MVTNRDIFASLSSNDIADLVVSGKLIDIVKVFFGVTDVKVSNKDLREMVLVWLDTPVDEEFSAQE